MKTKQAYSGRLPPSSQTAMKWIDILVHEYAGSPFRVVTNTLALACLGIFLGHWFFGMPIGDRLVMAAMTPGLIAIVSAALLKEKREV